MSVELTEPSSGAPRGPFVSALVGLVLALGLIIAAAVGMPLTLMTVMAVIIPGMTLSTMAIAVAMGWVFVSIGRYKQMPWALKGTWIVVALTTLALLWMTHVADSAGKIQ